MLLSADCHIGMDSLRVPQRLLLTVIGKVAVAVFPLVSVAVQG